jgi:hypothetical protein
VGEYLSAEDSWKGHFWLPSQPDQQQRGTLTYKPDDGLTLSLIGGFDDRRWTRIGPNVMGRSGDATGRWPVIHGVVGSKPITLLDCLAVRSTSTGMLDGYDEQEIHAQCVLMGVLLGDGDVAAFSSVTVELENLAEFNHRPDLQLQFEREEDDSGWKQFRIIVDPEDSLTVEVDDLTIELGRRYQLPSFDTRRDRVQAGASAYSHLTVTSSRTRSVSEWMDIVKVLQDLITLAMDAPCAVLSESLTPSDELLALESAEARQKIQVYAAHITVGNPDARGVDGRDGMFTLGTEGVDFETLVPRWLEVNRQLKVACNMILGRHYVDSGYLQTDLITAVGAAEALHEGLGFGPAMPNPEYKALKKKLLDSIEDDERRKWVREKLGHNTRTLRTKLLDLAATPDAEVMAKLLPNPEAWAQATKKERDPVAHGGSTMSADFALLSAITKVTTAVVTINLLHQLNIPNERILLAFDYNRTLRTAAWLARKWWQAGAATEELETN